MPATGRQTIQTCLHNQNHPSKIKGTGKEMVTRVTSSEFCCEKTKSRFKVTFSFRHQSIAQYIKQESINHLNHKKIFDR